MTKHATLSVMLLAALGALGDPVRAQDATRDIAMDGRYRQTAEVRSRYPDIAGLDLRTPALTPGRETPTTQAELEQALLRLITPGGPAALQTLAVTTQGRMVPVLWLTADGDVRPEHLRTVGRPVVWILAQQHGDEPAGAEAALALAQALVDGELRPLLDRLTVVIVPRLNPDGAAAETRDDAGRQDLNRDHGSMTIPVVQALHRLVQLVPPDLVLDLHEFSVARRWIEKFGALQAVDLMWLDATHPMVPAATTALARELFTPALEAATKQAQIVTFPYHTTSTRRSDTTISLGGNAPGIARNAFGLTGAVSFLFETRGVGIGTEGYQRRIATHYLAVRAMLKTAAQEAERLRDTVAAARRDSAVAGRPLIIASVPSQTRIALPLLDPLTGAGRLVDVVMTDGRRLQQTTERTRPEAYALVGEVDRLRPSLQAFGARICRLTADVEVDGEMFELRGERAIDRRAINPEASVTVTLRPARVVLPMGSLVVPTQQPAGPRLAMALEPDAAGSWLAMGLLSTSTETNTVPVIRLERAATSRLPTAQLDAQGIAGAACEFGNIPRIGD